MFGIYTVFFEFIENTLKFPFYQGRGYCESNEISVDKIRFNLSVLVIDRLLMIDILLLPIIIVLKKSKKDIFSGISKLDNLILISVF